MRTEVSRPARGEGTRQALLAAAGRLLDRGGVEAVTLREVGRLAGVSRAAPYRHFEDKAGLLRALVVGYFERLGQEVTGAAGGAGEPLEKLEAMMEAYARFALESPARYRLMFGEQKSGLAGPEVRLAAGALHEGFVRVVAECQAAGGLPEGDPVRLTALMWATAHGTVDLAFAGHAEEAKGMDDAVGVVRYLLEVLRRG